MVTGNFYKKLCNHSKILVVDDDGFNIHALKLLINAMDYQIDSASNG